MFVFLILFGFSQSKRFFYEFAGCGILLRTNPADLGRLISELPICVGLVFKEDYGEESYEIWQKAGQEIDYKEISRKDGSEEI